MVGRECNGALPQLEGSGNVPVWNVGLKRTLICKITGTYTHIWYKSATVWNPESISEPFQSPASSDPIEIEMPLSHTHFTPFAPTQVLWQSGARARGPRAGDPGRHQGQRFWPGGHLRREDLGGAEEDGGGQPRRSPAGAHV